MLLNTLTQAKLVFVPAVVALRSHSVLHEFNEHGVAMSNPKRAITLAGGGPAAGLHIGALQGIEDHNKTFQCNIEFDVWALSCIGAWVGVIYNQWDGPDKAQRTYDFFHDKIFRDDSSYSRFPVNAAFGPDLQANRNALMTFLLSGESYQGLVQPDKILEALRETINFWSDPKSWTSEGDINHWMLNQVLAVHPASRFLTSLIYLSQVNGLSRIYYHDSSFLKSIKFENLFQLSKPFIYHNAWNVDKHEMHLFSNVARPRYQKLTSESLCACSALPYIEEPVTINGEVYSEGALIDTVNFRRLIEDHPDLDEVWVSRIVDVSQAKAPKNITEAIGNLCMIFAGSLGDDDVRLFKYHARDEKWCGTIYEIEFAAKRPHLAQVTFDWNQSNLENGRKRGYTAMVELLSFHDSIKYYLNGDLTNALRGADALTREDYALGQVARAVVYQAAGDQRRAKQAVDCLLETDSAWYKYPSRELGKTFYSSNIVERLMQDLQAAGLP